MTNKPPEATISDTISPLDALLTAHYLVLIGLKEDGAKSSILAGLGGGESLLFPYDRDMSPHERLGLLEAFPHILMKVIDYCFALLDDFAHNRLCVSDYPLHFQELLLFLGRFGILNSAKARIAMSQLHTMMDTLPVIPEKGMDISLRSHAVLTLFELGFTFDAGFFRALASEDKTSYAVVFRGLMQRGEDENYDELFDWLDALSDEEIHPLFTTLRTVIDKKRRESTLFWGRMIHFCSQKHLSLPTIFQA